MTGFVICLCAMAQVRAEKASPLYVQRRRAQPKLAQRTVQPSTSEIIRCCTASCSFFFPPSPSLHGWCIKLWPAQEHGAIPLLLPCIWRERLLGVWVDDYGDTHNITSSCWSQGRDNNYNIKYTDRNGTFLVAQNDAGNTWDAGEWSRYDWVFNKSIPLPYVS